MHKKDKLKLYVFLVIVVTLAICYFVGGKESILLKAATISSVIVWLCTMIYVKHKM